MANSDAVFQKLSSKETLTRADLAELLRSLKGQSKEVKKEKVRELVELVGDSHNHQGIHVVDTLDSYEDF